MKYLALAAWAALAIGVAPPVGAAEADAAPTAAGGAAITFQHYRDWRLVAMDRRRSELAMQLAASDLPAQRKARLEETRAYYDWLAGLSEAERDRRFRERFDRIDANHDGVIDTDERARWRERQRAYYGSRKSANAAGPASH